MKSFFDEMLENTAKANLVRIERKREEELESDFYKKKTIENALRKAEKSYIPKIRKEIRRQSELGFNSLTHYIRWRYDHGAREVSEKIMNTFLDEGFGCTYNSTAIMTFFGNRKEYLVINVSWYKKGGK